MRYLNVGETHEIVSGILGDTVAIIEKHHDELIFTPAVEGAWNRVHMFATKVTAEGTV
jgi:hypothetical protein